MECIMHPFGIVPHKPVDEFSIEYYGCEQILHVVIEKLMSNVIFFKDKKHFHENNRRNNDLISIFDSLFCFLGKLLVFGKEPKKSMGINYDFFHCSTSFLETYFSISKSNSPLFASLRVCSSTCTFPKILFGFPRSFIFSSRSSIFLRIVVFVTVAIPCL